MNYPQALKALEDRQEARIELGLPRVVRHLERLGSPQRGLACVHVAGTNGKGSVCAMLESVLRGAGYRTGLYVSPHLFDVRERISAGGRRISEADFARLMSRALKADPGKKLTYFELLTSVAFQYFAERKVEVAVLETGLGGRLDATNVIERPLACVITSVDFDHMRFLGRRLEDIAAEKAGIIKAGCPVVCPKLPPAALKVVKSRAKEVGAPLTVVRRPYKTVRVDWEKQRQVLEDPQGRRYPLGLLGRIQAYNVALARAALDQLRGVLPVRDSAWKSLSRVRWPGRFEVRRIGSKTVVLDGAHNPEAMRRLAGTWEDSPWSLRKARWIIGVMKDKDASGILEPVSRHLREVVTVRPPSPRAMDPVALARLVRRRAPWAHVAAERDCETALGAWLGGPNGKNRPGTPRTAVVCGSFYLVGRAARMLGLGGDRG